VTMSLARSNKLICLQLQRLSSSNYRPSDTVLSTFKRFSSSMEGDSESDEHGPSFRARSSSPGLNSAVVDQVDEASRHQRVWLPSSADEPLFWNEDVMTLNLKNPHNLEPLLDRIETQELEGGRYRMKQHGVLHEDPAQDMVRC
jgi:hypothetical protein